jgi:hypothetical protein
MQIQLVKEEAILARALSENPERRTNTLTKWYQVEKAKFTKRFQR